MDNIFTKNWYGKIVVKKEATFSDKRQAIVANRKRFNSDWLSFSIWDVYKRNLKAQHHRGGLYKRVGDFFFIHFPNS